MTTKEIIRSQYLASLEMLNQAIIQCPDNLWADTKFNNQFWQIANHALFYAHLYLQPSEDDFIPWQKHNENYHSFEALSSASTDESTLIVYKKDAVLEYLEVCRQEVDNQVAALNIEAESSFPCNDFIQSFRSFWFLESEAFAM